MRTQPPFSRDAGRLWLRTVALLIALGLGLALSWRAEAQEATDARINQASQILATVDGPYRELDDAARVRIIQFVMGNALFTVAHELGHAVIAEFDLPVLGREEDAADGFATLALLYVGTDFTHRVLVDAARGLLLLSQHDASAGSQPVFYDEHGLDQQRAYAIVCLMVGSDPRAFRDLAARAKLPADRQDSCQDDFDKARDAWRRLLEPHVRTPPKPSFWERLVSPRKRSTSVDAPETLAPITYGDATGPMAPFKDMLKTLGLFEDVRSFAAKNLTMARPIGFEARTCGDPNAFFDQRERKVVLCYEFLAFQASLAASQKDSDGLQ